MLASEVEQCNGNYSARKTKFNLYLGTNWQSKNNTFGEYIAH